MAAPMAKSGTRSGSNAPNDTGVGLSAFVKAFRFEGKKDGELVAAQGMTSRTAIQFAANPANVEVLDTFSSNWNHWNASGDSKAIKDQRAKGQLYFCEHFDLGELPSDKTAAAIWRNDIRRLKPYVEMVVSVHRHGWADSFT